MLSHALLIRLLSYTALLAIARVFMILMGAWYCYWQQLVTVETKTIGGFIGFLLPRKLLTHRCVRIDLCLVVLRKLTGAWGVVPVAASIALIAPVVYGFCADLFGVHTQTVLPIWVNVGVVVVLLLIHDFCEYIVHAASHSNRILWEFHKTHHSAEFMTPITAKRAHFVDDLARMAVIGPTLGISVGIIAYLLKMPPVESSLFGLDAYVIGNLLSFENLRHSHIPLSYGSGEAYLMSPAQHQFHHNRYGTPRNFGSFLSLWDRLFGTFAYSPAPGSFEIGLHPNDQRHYNAVWKLYARPFWNVGVYVNRSWRKRRRSRAAAPVSGAVSSPVNS